MITLPRASLIPRFRAKAGPRRFFSVRVVSQGMGLDPRIGLLYLEAGAGFGGPCLEKDLRSLISQYSQLAVDSLLLEAVLHRNRRQGYALVEKLVQKLGNLKGKRIGVLGLAFKPGTDDIRDSHCIPIIRQLFSLEAVVTVHDPLVGISREKDYLNDRLPGLEWATSPYMAAEGKDGLLILTAWPGYRKLDLEKLGSCLSTPVIVDGRNLFDPRQARSLKIDYQGVGI